MDVVCPHAMTNSPSLDIVSVFNSHDQNLARTLAALSAQGYPWRKDRLRKDLIAAGALDPDARRKDGKRSPQLRPSVTVPIQPQPVVVVPVQAPIPPKDEPPTDDKERVEFTPDGNTAEAFYRGRQQITTLEDLLAVAKVDTSVWQVENFIVNQWEMGYKDANEQANSWPLFQVKATLRRIALLPVNFEPIAPIEITIRSRPQAVTTTRGLKRAVILPDMQVGFYRDPIYGNLVPLHDRRAVDVALQVITDLKPDTVVWLGDDLDLADWSTKYISSPSFKQSTQAALVELAWSMGKVRAAVPNATLKKLAGNHDERMAKAIISNMEQAYQLRAVDQLQESPALSVERLLALDRIGVEYLGPYPQGEFWINDNTRTHHGETVRGGSGKTTSKVAEDLRSNEVFGHIHRVEIAYKTLWCKDGPKVYFAFSPGTLASILPGRVPGFKSHQNWQNGFGVMDYDDTDMPIQLGVSGSSISGPYGLATITPVVIYDGVCIYNSTRYTAREEDAIVGEIIAETGFDVSMGYLLRKKAA